MAFKCSNAMSEPWLWFRDSVNFCKAFRKTANNFITKSSVEDVTWDYFEGVYVQATIVKRVLQDAVVIPFINEFVKWQLNDENYDFIAEANAIVILIDDFRTEVYSNAPADASGWLLMRKIDLDDLVHGMVYRMFSTAQTATVCTKLQAIVDEITLVS